MKTIKVFPSLTRATPDDENVRIACEPFLWDEADKVEISVTFTWDLPLAEKLYNSWKHVATTEIGGPATGMRGEEFTPGRFVKNGYVLTSRGCNNKCWFCSVWKRDGKIRELPITAGYNVLDDNLLSCSDEHIKNVFNMLSKQKHRPEFTGGLEAKILKQWHVDELQKLKPKQMFFAYDTPDDYDPLVVAGKMLIEAGMKNKLRCYVLCGYPKDTFDKAEKRMLEAISAGFMPMAMLYRDHKGSYDVEWRKWQRLWARPAIIRSRFKDKFS